MMQGEFPEAAALGYQFALWTDFSPEGRLIAEG
jgi:hypothetical protein